MTQIELISKVTELGLSFSFKQAMTGSVYYNIDSIKYRISDHYQPSSYQIRDYIDCNSIIEIYQLVLENVENKKKINTWDEYIYIDEDGGYFIENENFKK
jgi:hypothetical protein